ncbi:MAG: SGNH/GDSL hydrolase family protein [bacterium]
MKNNSEGLEKTGISKKKRVIFAIVAAFLTLILISGIGELVLRVLPVRGTRVECFEFDPLVGTHFYPHSTVIYCNDKGNSIRRKVNSFGYLDTEHNKEKKIGVYRIGFFGDSFTDARQVVLEETFFKIIERKLKDYNVESLSFGVSGFGTIQSYLNSKRYADYFDLDLVVYVFCENDLGDNIKEIKKSPNFPSAVLKENGFGIDYSFRGRNNFKKKTAYRAYNHLKRYSLLMSTVVNRMRLLMAHGVKVKVTEEDVMMGGESEADRIPDGNDFPSSWPDKWREYAQSLISAIILRWQSDVDARSGEFAILYIPRQGEMEKETEKQNSWKPLLESLSTRNKIAFIDPTSDLLKTEMSGKKVFHDHFSNDGHIAFAETFVDWFVGAHKKT